MGADTHKLMLDHSKAKVQLYGSYLDKYINIISQDGYTNRIHLYDLFCGEGIYDGEGKGSPMIALDAIRKYYDTSLGKMPFINLTLNDIDPEVIAKLRKTLKSDSIFIPEKKCTIRILTENYLNLINTVSAEINSLGKEKAVVFLDPKGYKEISIAHLKRFLSNKSEVLVFLPIRDMFRFANMKEEERNASHEPLHTFIADIFQNNPPRFNSQLDFIHKIKDGLKTILPQFFVDTFSLERETGQFFCLFFFTSHIKGFEKMLETKWELDKEQGRAWRYEKTGTMFSGSEILDFPEKLKDFICSGKKWNSQLYEYCLHEGFLPKHANEILRDWQEKNVLRVFNSDGSDARKKSFYLNYEEYKNEPKKVYFTYIRTLF